MLAIRDTWHWQKVAALLALCAIMLRVAVPAGFMLAPHADVPRGAIPIVLCTGSGSVTAWLGEDGSLVTPGELDAHSDNEHGDDDPSQAGQHADCVFAHAATAVPHGQTEFLPVAFHGETVAGTQERRDLVPGRGLAAPPPPSTAPPTLI
jgi:hypothetical protein